MQKLQPAGPWLVIPLLACCLPLLGCGTPGEERAEARARKVRVFPSDLFRGDLKRVEPHLDLNSACVKVEFDRPEVQVWVYLYHWQKDKRVREQSATRTFLKSPSELSLSLKEVYCRDGKWRYQYCWAHSDRGPTGWERGTLPLPRLKTSFTKGKVLPTAIEVAVNEQVAVCGIMAGEGADKVRPKESVEEMARRVEWALVLKLKPLKEE